MAIMDDHAYQSAHTQHHYSNFDNHFQSYSTPSSTHSSPPTYPVTLPYSHASSHMQTEYQQNHDFQPVRPQHPLHRHSYSGQTLHVMTEGPIDHDPLDYTAHPSRPHTHYQFHVNGHQNQSSKRDDDESGAQSYDRSGEILPVCNGFNRPLNHHEQERIAHLDKLKFFLATAPSRWDSTNSSDADGSALVTTNSDPSNSMSAPGQPPSSHPALNRFLLPTSEYVSCVLWNGLYHITGTDIVRALVFRFEAFGRPVRNMKKFEEGIFSDLRNLKPGVDACLEEPKSPFLDLLFKYQCIRTQKKQKVFYWFSVPHDRLFLDALERDLKREKMGLEPTTTITGEPALSFTYDSKKSLYEQFSKAQGGKDGEGELEAAVRRADEAAAVSGGCGIDGYAITADASRKSSLDDMILVKGNGEEETVNKLPPALQGPNTAFYSMFSLFEGSPTYKQRRKKLARASRKASGLDGRSDNEDYQRRGESVIDMGIGYGPTDSAMSAADMFVAQAKGELGSANSGEREKERQRKEITVTPASTFSDMQHQVTLQHPLAIVRPSQGSDLDPNMNPPQLLSRPVQEHRHNTFPIASTSQNPYPHLGPRPHALSFPVPSSSDLCSSGMETPQGKTKVFVCPLYSCCRFFKRMEHLKRHLRTHTLERPYQCKRCSKRFSRSDNLNQHIRTHTRADSEGGNTSGYDDEQADIESEGMDELDGDEAYNTRVYPNGVRNLQTPDIKMCEMEVSGNVQEIHGDEEGLVAAAGTDYANGGQDVYYAPNLDPYGNSQLSSGTQWTGAVNGPSSHTQMAQAQRSHTPLTSSSGYMRQSPAVYGSDSEYVTSISAPSHKQMFDHSSLYPPHLGMMEPSSGPGPIRRYRSMTPSLIRGENVRRPMTASTDFGSPGRGYHPYAIPVSGYVSQSSASTQSSPASYHVPLDYTSSQAASMGGVSRSESAHRSSSNGQLQDQMHQMLNLDQVDDSIFTHTSSSSSQQPYEEVYRTESPLPFAGAARSGPGSQFNKHIAGHDQGMYTQLPDTQADQFVSHTVDPGYFSALSQPHHHVTM